jgi:4-amino-4-deoxy-L-arabinose transferase-like glycosyltransferase
MTFGIGSRRFGLGLIGVALAALTLRVVYVLGWHYPAEIGGDAYYYHYAANLLADGKGFPNPFRLLQDHQTTPGAQHPPLYIVMLAASSIVGLSTYLDHQLLSCLLGSLTVFFCGILAGRLAGPRAGLVVAVIAAVYPNLWLNDALVLSETLVQLTSVLVVLAAYTVWCRPQPRYAFLLGAMVGLAALTRAEQILLALVLVVPLCLLLRSVAWRRRLALLVVAAVGVVVLIGPWCGYNLTRFREPVLLSAGLDPTLVIANCDRPYYGRDRGYWSFACFTALPPISGDESEQGKVLRKVADDYISAHRKDLPRVVAQRIGRTWGLYQPVRQIQLDTIFTREKPASRLGLGMFYVLALASVAGAVLLRRRRLPLLPLLSLAIVVTAAVALTFGQTRYRASAEVTVVVLGGIAIAALSELPGRRSARHRITRAG